MLSSIPQRMNDAASGIARMMIGNARVLTTLSRSARAAEREALERRRRTADRNDRHREQQHTPTSDGSVPAEWMKKLAST